MLATAMEASTADLKLLNFRRIKIQISDKKGGGGGFQTDVMEVTGSGSRAESGSGCGLASMLYLRLRPHHRTNLMGKSRLFRFTPTNDLEVKSRSSLSDRVTWFWRASGGVGDQQGATCHTARAKPSLKLMLAAVTSAAEDAGKPVWNKASPAASRISLQTPPSRETFRVRA